MLMTLIQETRAQQEKMQNVAALQSAVLLLHKCLLVAMPDSVVLETQRYTYQFRGSVHYEVKKCVCV